MPTPRQDLRRALHAVAFQQAGYFTAAQALEVGYFYQAQKYHADAGNWLRVDRALFRLPEWPADADDVYVRWTLWSEGRGRSCPTSPPCQFTDCPTSIPSKVHLTVPPGFGAVDDLVALHVDVLTEDERERRRGWAVTTPLRTLVDAAASELSQEHVDRAVADAVRLGATTRRPAAAGVRRRPRPSRPAPRTRARTGCRR